MEVPHIWGETEEGYQARVDAHTKHLNELSLQPQHLCDKKDWGFIEIKLDPLDGWKFWADDEPITEIDFCPWCGAKLEEAKIPRRQ